MAFDHVLSVAENKTAAVVEAVADAGIVFVSVAVGLARSSLSGSSAGSHPGGPSTRIDLNIVILAAGPCWRSMGLI